MRDEEGGVDGRQARIVRHGHADGAEAHLAWNAALAAGEGLKSLLRRINLVAIGSRPDMLPLVRPRA
jgi:hypothetical protein